MFATLDPVETFTDLLQAEGRQGVHMETPSTVGTVTRERGRKAIATNRQARHLYVVVDTVEAGVVLLGNEVKSLRLGRASLVDAFAAVDGHEVWMYNLHVAEYALGSWTNHATRRKRKLLLHRSEILNGKSGCAKAPCRWCRCACTSATGG